MALEIGVQLHLPTYRDKALPELIALGQASEAAGVGQLWVTDNLESRSNFVVLAALAARIRTKLGTAILGQYFRNPVQAASALMSLAELMDGREFCARLGAGNPYTYRQIEMPRLIGFVRETASILGRLLRGERVEIRAFPIIADYFRLNPEWSLRLAAPRTPISILWRWQRSSRTEAGRQSDGRRPPRPDHAAAREFVAGHRASLRTLSLRRRGYSDDDFRVLGINPATADAIEAANAAGKQFHVLRHLVTDAMIDTRFIAGDAAHCRERLSEVAAMARKDGFEQVILSELGPDPAGAIDLLMTEVIPEAFGR